MAPVGGLRTPAPLDVGDEPPLEARAQALLDLGNVLRRRVARDDDLLSRLVEVVERVEELFLGPLLARDELDVVDQEQVDRAIARAELGGAIVADRVDQLVGESLRGEIRDRHAREEAHGLMTDGVQEMRLAEPDSAVDEERVVRARWELGHGLARRLGELVRRADHERVERVARVEPLDGAAARRPLEPRRRRRLGGDRFIHDQRDARMTAQHFARGLMERVEVVLREPIARELVRCADAQVVPFDREQAARADPVVEDRRGKGPGQGVDESSPKVFQHDSRPHLLTELSTSVDSSGPLVLPEYCAAGAHIRTKLLAPIRRTMDGGL